MAISLRERVEGATGKTDISAGLVGSILHSFYVSYRDAYPYLAEGSATAFSLRSTLEGFRIPTGFNSASYYPEDSSGAHFSSECNGITASETHWFVTSDGKLYRIPITDDLDGNSSVFVELPDALKAMGYSHMGDPAFWRDSTTGQEYVLVPIDPANGHSGLCVCYSAPGLQYHGHYEFNKQGVGWLTAWCAVDPGTDVYYCSEFCLTSGLVIHPYTPGFDSSGNFELTPFSTGSEGIGIFNMAGQPASVFRVQGGAASSRSHLYLVSDVEKAQGGGLKIVEMATGTIQELSLHMRGDFQSTGTYGNGECHLGDVEYQGVCVRDVDGVSHHAGVEGQLHWVSLNNGAFDAVTIAHFEISDISDKPWI